MADPSPAYGPKDNASPFRNLRRICTYMYVCILCTVINGKLNSLYLWCLLSCQAELYDQGYRRHLRAPRLQSLPNEWEGAFD